MKCCWSCHRDTPLLRPTLNTGFLSGAVQTRRAISHEASWVGTRLPGAGAPWTPEAVTLRPNPLLVHPSGQCVPHTRTGSKEGRQSSWFPLMLVSPILRESALGRRGEGTRLSGRAWPRPGDTHYGAVDGVQVVGDGLPRPRH